MGSFFLPPVLRQTLTFFGALGVDVILCSLGANKRVQIDPETYKERSKHKLLILIQPHVTGAAPKSAIDTRGPRDQNRTSS